MSEERWDRIESKIDTLTTEVGVLKADVGVLKADVGVLKADVGRLDVGFAELQDNQVSLHVQVARLDQKVHVLHGRTWTNSSCWPRAR